MQPYQERVVSELAEVAFNLGKLKVFLQSPAFKALDPLDQFLLETQARAMEQYVWVLTERVARFKIPAQEKA
jgi:hypothetical protein